MSRHFIFICHTTEVKTEHFKRSFGWLAFGPQADEQTGNNSQIDLYCHTILRGAEQMATAEDAFEPPKKEFNRKKSSTDHR
jgi:hypothetical protein